MKSEERRKITDEEFDKVSKQVTKAWANVPDAVALVRDLRGEEESE